MATFSNTKWNPEYLPTDDKEKVRLVGIEFEGRVKNISEVPEEYQFLTDEYMDDKKVGYPDGQCTLKGYKTANRDKFMTKELEKLGIEVGGVGYDGGGKEIVTMPDSINLYHEGGSERLKKLVEVLKASTEADKDSGTHVNVSKLSSDVKTTWNNVYWFCMCFGPQIQKIFGRRSHWANIPLPKDYFYSNRDSTNKVFEAPKKQPTQTPCQSKGTIVVDKVNRYEFRGPKASHDLEEILAWAEFCSNVVDICANGYIQDIPFSDALKGKYIRAYANKIGKNNPERKLTPAERAMRISEIGYVKIIGNSKIL